MKRVAVRPESDGEYCLLRSVDRAAASLTHNRTCCGTRARQRISAFSKSAPGGRHARSEARFRGRAIPSQRIPSPEVPQFTDVADPSRETNLSHTLARNPRGYHGRGSFEGAALTGEPRWRLRRHQRVPGEGQPPVSTLRLSARRSFRVSWIPAGLLRPTELASATATSSRGDPKKSAAPARNPGGGEAPAATLARERTVESSRPFEPSWRMGLSRIRVAHSAGSIWAEWAVPGSAHGGDRYSYCAFRHQIGSGPSPAPRADYSDPVRPVALLRKHDRDREG
jgi:hypothetical protein